MIYKLQWPLTPPPTGTIPILAYRLNPRTKEKEDQRMLPLTPEIEKLFDGRLKIYVEAEPWCGELKISGTVKNQRW